MLASDAQIEPLVRRIETVLGASVRKLTRPGGPDRPVLRAYLADHSVIVLARTEATEAEKERAVLRALAPETRHVPELIVHADGLTVLSDGGTDRLPVALWRARPEDRLPLVLRAIDALLDVQRAARRVRLPPQVAPLGTAPDWIAHYVRGPRRMAKMLGLEAPPYDTDALEAALAVPDPAFVKWDARAANAAIAPDGHLTWFDFEHCGLRQGAEDIGWLISDEVFPLDLARDFDTIAQHVAAEDRKRADARLGMLEVFAVLQASFRLRVVLNEVREKGWTKQRHILAEDLVGADPYMAERLARNGAALARRRADTRPLADLFLRTADRFAEARTRRPD